jgi:hypothetical protein
MKIKALANVGASGKSLKAGKQAEVSDRDGKILISLGKAELVKSKAAPKAAPKTEAAEAEVAN